MKISELIKFLEAYKEKHGDVPIWVPRYSYKCGEEIEIFDSGIWTILGSHGKETDW